MLRNCSKPKEGVGSALLRAFSAYCLSNSLTAAAAAFYAERYGFTFEKFVIPNPFGPCGLEFGAWTEFVEPPVPINADLVNGVVLGCNEARSWDNLSPVL